MAQANVRRSKSPSRTEKRKSSGVPAAAKPRWAAANLDTVAGQIAKRAPANTYEQKLVLRQQVMGIAMRPGQAELKKTLDDFVARNKANGELNKLYQKWLGTDFPAMPNS